MSGDPIPAIQWYKDKRPVIPGHDVQMSYDGECATLKFNKILLSDSARYTCVAKNAGGEVRTSTKITVKGRSLLLD